jgi:hypothetical protein
MPSLGLPGDAKFTIALVIGVSLIALARWASRVPGTRSDSWIALRMGNVLFTEVLGAFLIGYGLGGIITDPQAGVAGGGPPGRFAPVGRFGGLSANLPLALGIIGSAIAVLTRLDLSGLALRGATPRNGLLMYVGWDARVTVPIAAGGFGQIAMRDGMGFPLSAVATAEIDLARGTPVKVIGTKGLNLLVAPVPSG